MEQKGSWSEFPDEKPWYGGLVCYAKDLYPGGPSYEGENETHTGESWELKCWWHHLTSEVSCIHGFLLHTVWVMTCYPRIVTGAIKQIQLLWQWLFQVFFMGLLKGRYGKSARPLVRYRNGKGWLARCWGAQEDRGIWWRTGWRDCRIHLTV